MIQPARQTGFTSAPRPNQFAVPALRRDSGNSGSRRNNNGGNRNNPSRGRQPTPPQQQQQEPRFGDRQSSFNSIDVQPGFKRTNSNSGGRRNSNNPGVRFQEQPRRQQQQQPGSRRNSNNNNGRRNKPASGRGRTPASTSALPRPASAPRPRIDGGCPGGSLEVCIDVCPSFSARIFGACVAGCARRCPGRK